MTANNCRGGGDCAWDDALIEAGLPGAEAEQVSDTLRLLATWGPVPPTAAETRSLIHYLEAVVAPSPKRAMHSDLLMMLTAARAQLQVFPISLWVGSAAVMLIGVALITLGFNPSRSLVLYLLGPSLAYLSISLGFRGSSLRTFELELSCPASPRQLVLARLVVLLGYDALAGLLLSVPLWTSTGLGLLGVTEKWLAPLLFAAGTTLLLSLRLLSVARAAALVYALWSVIVLLLWRLQGPEVNLGGGVEDLLAAAGLAALVATLALCTHNAPGVRWDAQPTRTFSHDSA